MKIFTVTRDHLYQIYTQYSLAITVIVEPKAGKCFHKHHHFHTGELKTAKVAYRSMACRAKEKVNIIEIKNNANK